MTVHGIPSHKYVIRSDLAALTMVLSSTDGKEMRRAPHGR